MSKKLQPSGYTIINIDASAQTSGTPFDPVTDDEKLLCEILSNGEFKKPILLDIIDPSGDHWCGFPIRYTSRLTFTDGQVGATTSLVIDVSSEQLIVEIFEE